MFDQGRHTRRDSSIITRFYLGKNKLDLTVKYRLVATLYRQIRHKRSLCRILYKLNCLIMRPIMGKHDYILSLEKNLTNMSRIY